MTAVPLGVLSSGMVAGVGATAPECCAGIRCGVNAFRETRFIGTNGEWLVGSAVATDPPVQGRDKLVRMAALAIGECMATAGITRPEDVPVLLVVAEETRPGRLTGLDSQMLQDIGDVLGIRLHAASRIVPQGRVGSAVALLGARRLLAETQIHRVIVAGVDSYLHAATLKAYGRDGRLLEPDNPNGFIPGEAAAAVMVGRADDSLGAALLIDGLGFGREPAFLGSGQPLRAEGLVAAIRGAQDEAGMTLGACDHRIADTSGEQFRFKEAALAMQRLLRQRKATFGLWHPADSIGEVGAAAAPSMLAVLLAGATGDYLPGPVFLGHLANDDARRAAFIARATAPQSLARELLAEERFEAGRREVHA